MPDQKTTSAEPAKNQTALPEQKLGDTPVAPWDMPTPEEKAEAKPARQALKQALDDVDSEEKADQVIAELESEAAGQTAVEVSQKTDQAKVATPAQAAGQVAEAARRAAETAPGEKAPKVLAET